MIIIVQTTRAESLATDVVPLGNYPIVAGVQHDFTRIAGNNFFELYH